MKIATLPLTDPWFSHVVGHRRAYVEWLAEVPVEATVLIDQVGFLYHGQEANFRPFLHLQGQLTGLAAPEVELPYGVTELEFGPGEGSLVDAFYEFDNEQLSRLASKGYFEKGFTVPPEMSGVPWVIPATARLVFVSPEEVDDPPVVFAEVGGVNELRMDPASSGYQLDEYFPDYALTLRQGEQAQIGFGPQAEANWLGVSEDLFADAPEKQAAAREDAAVAEAARPEPEPAQESPAQAGYRENVASRLTTPQASAQAAALGLDGVAEEFPDGILAFEPDEDVLENGILAFEPEDAALPDLAPAAVRESPAAPEEPGAVGERRRARAQRLQAERDRIRRMSGSVPEATAPTSDELEFD